MPDLSELEVVAKEMIKLNEFFKQSIELLQSQREELERLNQELQKIKEVLGLKEDDFREL